MEIPVENRTCKPGLCAGVESGLELPPNCVATPSQRNKVKAAADRVKVFNHGKVV